MTTDPQVLSTSPARGNFLTNLWDAKTARVLFTALLFVLFLAFLRGARETLTLFLFAILFAYFLAPPVGKLEHPLRGRGRAILVVYLILGLVLAGLGLLIGPQDRGRSQGPGSESAFAAGSPGALVN